MQQVSRLAEVGDGAVVAAGGAEDLGMIGGHAVFHDRIWVLGGGSYDTPATPRRKFYNDVWSSADGVHWERLLAWGVDGITTDFPDRLADLLHQRGVVIQ